VRSPQDSKIVQLSEPNRPAAEDHPRTSTLAEPRPRDGECVPLALFATNWGQCCCGSMSVRPGEVTLTACSPAQQPGMHVWLCSWPSGCCTVSRQQQDQVRQRQQAPFSSLAANLLLCARSKIEVVKPNAAADEPASDGTTTNSFATCSTRVAGADRQDTSARGKQLNAGREAMIVVATCLRCC